MSATPPLNASTPPESGPKIPKDRKDEDRFAAALWLALAGSASPLLSSGEVLGLGGGQGPERGAKSASSRTAAVDQIRARKPEPAAPLDPPAGSDRYERAASRDDRADSGRRVDRHETSRPRGPVAKEAIGNATYRPADARTVPTAGATAAAGATGGRGGGGGGSAEGGSRQAVVSVLRAMTGAAPAARGPGKPGKPGENSVLRKLLQIKLQTRGARPKAIRLPFTDPAGGEGQIHLALRGGSLLATILSSHRGTVERLEAGIRDLHHALNERGFPQSDITIRQTQPTSAGTPGQETRDHPRDPSDDSRREDSGRRHPATPDDPNHEFSLNRKDAPS